MIFPVSVLLEYKQHLQVGRMQGHLLNKTWLHKLGFRVLESNEVHKLLFNCKI